MQRFGAQLRERLEQPPCQSAQRSGDIEPTASLQGHESQLGCVPNIGQRFALRGLRGPVQQLLKLLIDQDSSFLGLKVHEPMQRPHLLKLAAAPGMGKTTALRALWSELHSFVSEHEDALRSQLEEWGGNLVERVLCSLKPDKPLVFTIDLSQPGLLVACLPGGVVSQMQLTKYS